MVNITIQILKFWKDNDFAMSITPSIILLKECKTYELYLSFLVFSILFKINFD